MKRNSAEHFISGALILLFTYAALAKLFEPEKFSRQMLNQVFAPWFNHALVFTVPALEIIAIILLMMKNGRYPGLWLSSALMACFSGYTGLVLLHVFKRVPCSCGGILGKLSWGPHFVFNLIFLGIAISGICLGRRERRSRQAQIN